MEGIRTSYCQPSEMMAFWRGKNERLVHVAQKIHYALSKLSQGKDVSTEVLGKICETLDCTIDDIMEFVPEEEK